MTRCPQPAARDRASRRAAGDLNERRGRPRASTNCALAERNENAARAGAAAHASKPSGSACAIGPPPNGPLRSPPYADAAFSTSCTPPCAAAACSSTASTLAGSVTSARSASAPAALTPSSVSCERATPTTAQPFSISASITARPRCARRTPPRCACQGPCCSSMPLRVHAACDVAPTFLDRVKVQVLAGGLAGRRIGRSLAARQRAARDERTASRGVRSALRTLARARRWWGHRAPDTGSRGGCGCAPVHHPDRAEQERCCVGDARRDRSADRHRAFDRVREQPLAPQNGRTLRERLVDCSVSWTPTTPIRISTPSSSCGASSPTASPNGTLVTATRPTPPASSQGCCGPCRHHHHAEHR